MRYILFISIFLSFSLISSAQGNKKGAFRTFKKGRNLYYEGNYKGAFNLFEESVNLLGEPNLMIQGFLVKSAFHNKDWINLEKEVQKYLDLPENKENKDHDEIEKIKALLEKRLEDEKNMYNEAKEKQTAYAYRDFLKKYYDSKFTNEIKKLLEVKLEDEAWAEANRISNTNSMFVYLEKYPLGRYSEIAKEKIDKWDIKAKNEAITENSQESYNYYLDEYTKGKFRIEILEKLKIKEEEDSYQAAKDSYNIYYYERYLSDYPQGKYVDQANSFIETKLFNSSEIFNKQKNFSKLLEETNSYISKYPNGKNIKEITQLNKKAKRRLKRYNSGMLLVTYETNEVYGLKVGSLRKSNLGWYFTARASANILEATFSSDLQEVQEQGLSIISEIETINANSSLGLTFPIAYPLYISGGVGVNYREYFFESLNKVNFLKENEKSYEIFPEANLIFKTGFFVFTAGASYIREEAIFKAGLGIKL